MIRDESCLGISRMFRIYLFIPSRAHDSFAAKIRDSLSVNQQAKIQSIWLSGLNCSTREYRQCVGYPLDQVQILSITWGRPPG